MSGDPDPGFNDRLLEIDPKLKDYSYGPQSYDAAIIIGAGGDRGRQRQR